MGSYVSVPICESQYNVTLDCSVTLSQDNTTFVSIGGMEKGGVGPDSDIAGIGILGVFVAVTAFALLVSIVDVLRQLHKTIKWKRMTPEERAKLPPKKRTWTDIMEALVQTCSDQQIFTGAAYALTLRYWRGCTISAYHYNIVANIMLLTCATHLMSVTIIRNYWKHPLLALARVLCVTGVFILAGVLLSNQNAASTIPFPTSVPAETTLNNGSLIYLSAACFQNASSHLTDIFRDSTSSADHFFVDALGANTPNNYIQGWRWYLVTLLFYLLAIIAEFIRFCRRGQKRPGWRRKVASKLRPYLHTGTHRRIIIKWAFLLYLFGGIGISCATTYYSTTYIYALRSYVNRSGWLDVSDSNGKNPEDDATSFGQLVPIFLSALLLFTLLQTTSEKLTDHKNRKYQDEEAATQEGSIPFLDPSNYDMAGISGGKIKPTVTYGDQIVTPGMADLESAQPWPLNKPLEKPPTDLSSYQKPSSDMQDAADTPPPASTPTPALGDEITSSAIALNIDPGAPTAFTLQHELALSGGKYSPSQTDTTNKPPHDLNYEAGLAAPLAMSSTENEQASLRPVAANNAQDPNSLLPPHLHRSVATDDLVSLTEPPTKTEVGYSRPSSTVSVLSAHSLTPIPLAIEPRLDDEDSEHAHMLPTITNVGEHTAR